MKVALAEVTAVSVGGSFIEINMDEELELDDSCILLDEDKDEIMESESPAIRFIGMDGNHYVVNLGDVVAFRIKVKP